MKKTPCVIIVDNSKDTTGAFNSIFYFAQSLSSDFNFVFVLPKGSLAGVKVKAAGYSLEYLPFVEISKSVKNILLYIPYVCINSFRLLTLVKKYKADIVHVNDFYNLTGATAKMLGGKYKLLTHVRFMPDRFPKPLLRLWIGIALKYAESIICVSNTVKKQLGNHPKFKVIYNTIPGIDNLRREVKIPNNSGCIRLLYLSHYIPGKGHDFALEAFHQAYQKDNRLRLKFVGGDMGLQKNKLFKEQLVNKAIALKLDHVIEFAEAVSDAKSELVQCDIFLNFSESESFSRTCLEALAYGVPLIATDCGGPAELFEHRESGFLVPNHDIEAMEKAILYLAGDENLRKTFTRQGFNYVSRKFAANNTLLVLKKVYEGLLL